MIPSKAAPSPVPTSKLSPGPVMPAKPILVAPVAPQSGPPTKVTPSPVAPPGPPSSQSLQQYIVSGMNLSMKACVEGEGSVCSLLKKACASDAASSQEEMQLCASLPSVCEYLNGADLAASICVVRSLPLSQAGEKICSALPKDQQASCLSIFKP